MSDEIDAAPNEDTPNVETPETAEVNWQKRYEDLRPEFDRSRQTLSRFESDPNAVVEFLQQHHPDLLVGDEDPDVDDEPDDDDTPDFMTKAEFKAWQDGEAAKADQKARNEQYETDIKKFVGDRDLSKFGRNAIDAMALRGEIKTPEQLEAAVQEWFAYEDSRATAPKKKAPHVLPGGKANTGVKPFHEMTRQEREDYMVERAQGLASQT